MPLLGLRCLLFCISGAKTVAIWRPRFRSRRIGGNFRFLAESDSTFSVLRVTLFWAWAARKGRPSPERGHPNHRKSGLRFGGKFQIPTNFGRSPKGLKYVMATCGPHGSHRLSGDILEEYLSVSPGGMGAANALLHSSSPGEKDPSATRFVSWVGDGEFPPVFKVSGSLACVTLLLLISPRDRPRQPAHCRTSRRCPSTPSRHNDLTAQEWA